MKKIVYISILLFFILEVTSFATFPKNSDNFNSLNITLNKETPYANEENKLTELPKVAIMIYYIVIPIASSFAIIIYLYRKKKRLVIKTRELI